MRKLVMMAATIGLAACTHSGADTIAEQMKRYTGDVPGASLLVLKDGKPLVQRAWGMANMEQGVRATPATNYRLASVTKQFTAAGILLLMEDGTLQLDDPLRQWLPELPPATADITLRQVLTHSSGLIDYETLMGDDYSGQISDQQVLELMAQTDRLYFPPGTAYRYSNTGYVLLGLVIERASDMTLPAFLKQRIFQPLGMDNTLLYEHHRGPQVPHRAYGYSKVNGQWNRTDQSPTSATRGDGGIYSSIHDLAKWAQAQYDDRLLSDASRQMAFKRQVKVTDEPWAEYYGFGWRMTGDTIWHSGETMGFRNVIIRWPDQHLTVVLLSNRNHPKPYQTALAIAEPYLESP